MSVRGQGQSFALVRKVAARIRGRTGGAPEPSPPPTRPAPAPEPPGRAEDGVPELWREPVPVVEDREGHLHLLL